jgi:hypothetical protein
MENDVREIEALILGEGAWSLSPARLRKLASRARKLRRKVEERWEELPQSLQEVLADLARSREASALADLETLLREVDLLFRAVMDQLEERDPAFREALKRALAEKGTPLKRRELRSLILD